MSKSRSSRHRAALRRAVCIRDRLPGGGYRCHWCGQSLTRRQVTVDHVLPLVAGGHPGRVGRDGDTNLGNIVIACDACNQRRSRGVTLGAG
jgi:5-methylcytosine-specific restriction endonuclease McrA